VGRELAPATASRALAVLRLILATRWLMIG
jgi:hypothetical protein